MADFARARILLATGRRGHEDCALAMDLLGRLLEHAEQLQEQRTALRAVIRAVVVEQHGRLHHALSERELVPMRTDLERAVRSALATVRPSAA